MTTIAVTHNKTIVSILLRNSDLSKLQSYKVRLTLYLIYLSAKVYKILMFKHQC